MTGIGVALVTASSVEEAEKLAKGIVENRLAACVNVVKGVDSFFWWDGKIDRAQEALLVIKTEMARFEELEKYVKGHHSYEVPEVILLPVEKGHRPYVNWVMESLRGKG